jgi:hypothetical protein
MAVALVVASASARRGGRGQSLSRPLSVFVFLRTGEHTNARQRPLTKDMTSLCLGARWLAFLLLASSARSVRADSTEGSAAPSLDAHSYSDTHTFVYEEGPVPERGYGRVRVASVSVPL